MKRRFFIKATGTLGALSVVVPSLGFNVFSERELKENYPPFILQDFKDEQEESPAMVVDGNGDLWIFTLRRLKYPQDKEVVSAFRLVGDKWKEVSPVTKKAGQYEAPAAACASNGKPIIAWCEINSGKWQINTSVLGENGFEKPVRLNHTSGKPINPVLIAPDKHRSWIAWESYEKGKFKIYISKFENAAWSSPIIIDKGNESCFDPALAESKNGDLFIIYGLTDGYHQNIEMAILDGSSMQIKQIITVATGGAFKDRINLNTKPALAFDAQDRLWISFENNRNSSRLEDGDNYTGDRCCAILRYQQGHLLECSSTGKWLFSGKNDHKPTFFKDAKGHLFLATHCGGNFTDNPFWQYRLSWLDPQNGWVEPQTVLKTSQKGALILPAMAFDKRNRLWLSTCIEKIVDNQNPEQHDGIVRSRLTQLVVQQLPVSDLSGEYKPMDFKNTTVEEFHLDKDFVPQISGHPKIIGESIAADGQKYMLVFGNLHEHSENSSCWPAGTDGTLHEDYRFGIHSEGYNFNGITDHGYTMNEVYWRKNLRLADFYTDPPYYVALPSFEWTKTSNKKLNDIEHGAGHHNVIFASSDEARKFIRNVDEIYNVNSPETSISTLLWEFLHKKNIDCITIPHHPADETHTMDWNVHDDQYVPVVELFQCRGNSEYPGCPRERNLERHHPTKYKRAFVNYALSEKKYKMGFIASGDHNSMGVGVVALWVKELSRDGILEALRSRRSFATTGDKMVIDFRINGTVNGSVVSTDKNPVLQMKVKGQRELSKIEILRNSEVIKEYPVTDNSIHFDEVFNDDNYNQVNGPAYYYIRVTQKNNALGWSSPVWVETV